MSESSNGGQIDVSTCHATYVNLPRHLKQNDLTLGYTGFAHT